MRQIVHSFFDQIREVNTEILLALILIHVVEIGVAKESSVHESPCEPVYASLFAGYAL